MIVYFEGRVTHTKQTIKTLFKTTYYVYEKKKILTRMAIGVVLAVAALFIPMPTVLEVILLMLGAWLLVSRDYPATERADKAIEARKGHFPTIKYTFSDKSIVLEDRKKAFLKYSQIQLLVEDDGYFYLFENKGSVCMIDKQTITPASLQDFINFLQEKTGKTTQKNKTFFQMNLYDLLGMLKK